MKHSIGLVDTKIFQIDVKEVFCCQTTKYVLDFGRGNRENPTQIVYLL